MGRELAYIAPRVHDRLTGREDSIGRALAERGDRTPSGPAPADPVWDFDSPAEIRRRLPRLADMFPPRQRRKD